MIGFSKRDTTMVSFAAHMIEECVLQTWCEG